MPKLTVIYKDPKSLRPREKNPRKHPKRQIEQLKRSITEFGFVRPVLLDGSDGIIAGHGSTLAAIDLGMTDIPTVRVDHLSPEQIRAYVIADNKLAENAGWDRELLALELKELSLNFDITLTGFEMPEVDLLLGELGGSGSDATDEIPEVDTRLPPVSRLGDLWRIGEHFLLCGDSTKRESYEALLRGAKAQAVFTDPPYNVRIAGNVSGLGKTVHPEFAMASGEMSQVEFTRFLETVFDHLAGSSVDGSLHYICMDWRHRCFGSGPGRSTRGNSAPGRDPLQQHCRSIRPSRHTRLVASCKSGRGWAPRPGSHRTPPRVARRRRDAGRRRRVADPIAPRSCPVPWRTLRYPTPAGYRPTAPATRYGAGESSRPRAPLATDAARR